MGKKVLIIKKDPQFIEEATNVLHSRGIEVSVANSSRHAVEAARRENPDLIIVGLVMDRLYSGCSVIGELRSEADTSAIPAIMVSGVTTETGFRIDEGGRVPGWLKVQAFFNEPIDYEALADQIVAMIGEPEPIRQGA